jgi:hypothetical protein
VDARRRFRPVDRPLFVHVYIHLDMGFLAYWPEGSPLSTPAGYWSFIEYLTLNLEYSVIQLAGIAIMDTHIHLLLVLMPGKLSLREVARRYNRRYRNDRTRKELNVRDHRAQLREERKKMQDMSNFTQRLFSAWAGDMAARTREKLGRQALHVRVCGDRHRESVPVSAVVAKIFALYVDRNPARAGLPASPPDRPRSTWEFLRHPKLRHLLNGFATWIGMAFDRAHECATHPGRARQLFLRARNAERQRQLERETAVRSLQETMAAYGFEGDGTVPFEPGNPNGCPYITCGGAIGYPGHIRELLKACSAPDISRFRLVDATDGSGLVALRPIRRRKRRPPPDTAPDPP